LRALFVQSFTKPAFVDMPGDLAKKTAATRQAVDELSEEAEGGGTKLDALLNELLGEDQPT